MAGGCAQSCCSCQCPFLPPTEFPQVLAMLLISNQSYHLCNFIFSGQFCFFHEPSSQFTSHVTQSRMLLEGRRHPSVEVWNSDSQEAERGLSILHYGIQTQSTQMLQPAGVDALIWVLVVVSCSMLYLCYTPPCIHSSPSCLGQSCPLLPCGRELPDPKSWAWIPFTRE